MKLERRLLTVAVLGAHSNFIGRGFRQKDIRFNVELLSNWMDVILGPTLKTWHNTQIMRFTNELQKSGYARVVAEDRIKKIQLTRLGLLELMNELVSLDEFPDMRHILLVYYFLKSYKERMIELIEREGSGFSKAGQLEIRQMLDEKYFVKMHIDKVGRQIQRVRARAKDAQDSANFAEKLKRQGETVSSIIQQVSVAHPYELQMQKPMDELLKEIDPEFQNWELIEGNRNRGQILWQTQLRILESNLAILSDLIKS